MIMMVMVMVMMMTIVMAVTMVMVMFASRQQAEPLEIFETSPEQECEKGSQYFFRRRRGENRKNRSVARLCLSHAM